MHQLFPGKQVGIDLERAEGNLSLRNGESGWGEGESWEEKSASL